MQIDEASIGVPASAVTQAPEAGPEFPPRARVLIVDDIAENRLVLGMFCDQFGLAHECVGSGREAVDAAASSRFDVILMDIFMPGMDGMAATRAIRSLPGRVAAAPIIAVTTAAESQEVLRYLSCGMNDVVAKPIRAARLLEALVGAFAEVRPVRRTRRPKAARPLLERMTA
jgi:CheY-like chemotaxis protein